jgi:hypothetical protein
MRVALLSLLFACASAVAADLGSAQPVYFWAMQGSLDQYLAEQATKAGAVTVTVDPKMAKAIMTDRIDAPFLAAMDELFPVEGREETKKSSESIEGDFQLSRPKNRPKGSPKGTLFLVDVKTRQVLWSTYLGDFDSRPQSLHREARKVIERLEQEMAPGS